METSVFITIYILYKKKIYIENIYIKKKKTHVSFLGILDIVVLGFIFLLGVYKTHYINTYTRTSN